MAERDKEEMESDIAKMEFDLKGTAVICRSGSPLILADLKKVKIWLQIQRHIMILPLFATSLITNMPLWYIYSKQEDDCDAFYPILLFELNPIYHHAQGLSF